MVKKRGIGVFLGSKNPKPLNIAIHTKIQNTTFEKFLTMPLVHYHIETGSGH